ncbi:hypothetical protein CTYAZ2_33160 [Comamonas testosteroni]|nr:hypothetical protein CTYAZ2_33160 [Comamonas testosteroni]
MQIHTQNVIILPPTASQDALTSMERLMQGLGRAEATAGAAQSDGKPKIGDYWPGQGGFYAGDMRGDDGTVYGLIVSDCDVAKDVGTAAWGPAGEHQLSEWDGLTNSLSLGASHPAAKRAATHKADQHSDFYLPARRELQLACATVPHLFGTDSWYWTSTTRYEDYAWAVDFEHGNTDDRHRNYEFRVRPVRRFIY